MSEKPRMRLRMDTLGSFDRIDPAEWEDLRRRADTATVFQSYAWNRTWWESFCADDRRLLLITAREGERLVGLAPLMVVRGSEATIRMVGEEHADYLSFLADRAVPAALPALMETVTEYLPDVRYAYLPQVPEASVLGRVLWGAARDPRGGVLMTGQTPCPGIAVNSEADVANILKKPSVKRHAAALAREGKLTVDHLHHADAIAPWLDRFFDQHVQRWAVTPYPSLFLDPRNREFYRNLAKTLSGGEALFTVLCVDGHLVAAHFGFVSASSLIWYKPSFDITWFRCSPGEVMLGELVRLGGERGVGLFDFTRGDEGFKARFANVTTYNSTYEWYAKPSRRRRRQRAQTLAGLAKRAATPLTRVPPVAKALARYREARRAGRSIIGAGLRAGRFLGGALAKRVYSHRQVALFCAEPAAGAAAPSASCIRPVDLEFLLTQARFPDEWARSAFLPLAFGRIKRNDQCFVAVIDGVVAAYGWATSRSPIPIKEVGANLAWDGSTACLYDFFVFPRYRGRGLYGQMVENVRSHVGDQRVFIFCDVRLNACVRAITRAGFRLERVVAERTILGRRLGDERTVTTHDGQSA